MKNLLFQEFSASFIFVYLSNVMIFVSDKFTIIESSIISAIGLYICLLIFSRVHLNPLYSLCKFLFNKIESDELFERIFGQISGCLIANAFIYYSNPNFYFGHDNKNILGFIFAKNDDILMVSIIECFGVFIYTIVFEFCNNSIKNNKKEINDSNNKEVLESNNFIIDKDSKAILLSLLNFVLINCLTNGTGCNINLIRSFGSFIFGNYSNFNVFGYFIGSFLGVIFGILFINTLFNSKDKSYNNKYLNILLNKK